MLRVARVCGCWWVWASLSIGVGLSEPLPLMTLHYGACDASAAAALNDRLFVVASDETSRLRTYVRAESGSAVWSVDFSGFLEVDPAHPETDIEGAARVGDVVYWITSHARNQEGKYRSSRHRFFATRIETTQGVVQVVPLGKPYRELVRDFVGHEPLRDLELEVASQLPPNQPGALNIEGLAAAPDGGLWIGFRNPVPEGRAVVVQMLNPLRVVDGHKAQLGQVVRLDLAGRGIRDMARSSEGYWILAGAYDGRGRTRLYRWGGPGVEPERVRELNLVDFNAEAVLAFPRLSGEEVYLLSDDSARETGGVPCRALTRPSARSFRSVMLP